MRKLISALLVSITLLLNSTIAYADTGISSSILNVNKDFISEGLVKVKFNLNSDKKLKLMLRKDQVKYYYNVKKSDEYEAFPLQLGEGDYELSLLENIGGNQYKYIYSENLKLDLKDNNDVYLNSIQIIKWNDEMESIRFAKDLVKDIKSDEEKIKAIYNYVIVNFKYDYDKIKTLTPDYIPNIDDTFVNKKGICYDYSSLFASMLRSVDIPTKLIMGYTSNVGIMLGMKYL